MKPYLWGILSGAVLLIVAVTLYLVEGRLSEKQDRRRTAAEDVAYYSQRLARHYAHWDVYREGRNHV